MSKVTVCDHPLIQHKLGVIRNKNCGTKDFRTIVSEIAGLMCYEATRDLKLEDVEIETPITKMTAKQLSGRKLAVVPILRAGLGMVEGMLTMIPAAKVGHIGLYRDPKTRSTAAGTSASWISLRLRRESQESRENTRMWISTSARLMRS